MSDGIVLVAAHHLQHPVAVIRHRIKADELMCHRDAEQLCDHLFPIIDRLIVEIRPMKMKVRLKTPIRSGICKIKTLFRIHRNKNLHQCHDSGVNPLVRIFLNLMYRFLHRHTGSLQFHMKDRHPVDQKQQISAAILQNLFPSPENRLLCNLVHTASRRNLHPVINP